MKEHRRATAIKNVPRSTSWESLALLCEQHPLGEYRRVVVHDDHAVLEGKPARDDTWERAWPILEVRFV